MDVDSAALEVLDSAARPFESYDLVGSALVAALGQPEGTAQQRQHLEALAAGFFFHLNSDYSFEGGYRGSAAAPWPRDVGDVPVEVRGVWAAYAKAATHPALRARLRHLLWVAKDKDGGRRPIDHLQAAVEDYRQAVPLLLAAGGPHATVSRWKAMVGLRTAYELAISTKQPSLPGIVTEMLSLADEAMGWPESSPGVVGAIVELLMEHKEHHDALRPLVERAADHFSDPHVRIDFLKDLRRIESDAEGRRSIDERISDTYAAHSERLGGFGKLLCLEEAAVHARDASLSDAYERFQGQQQSLAADDLQLSLIGVPVSLPSDFFDAANAVIDAAADVGEALGVVVSTPPALPDVADGADQGQDFLRLDTVKINRNGPVITTTIPAQGSIGHRAGADPRLLVMEVHGLLVGAQLDRVRERFGAQLDGLFELFTHPIVTPAEKAKVIARIFRAYWENDDDVAITLALRTVEGMLRRYLKAMGIPVIQHVKGDRVGQVDQLGTLIRKMESGQLGDLMTFFRLLLADPTEGMNLRNDVLHDLVDCPPRHRIALVLQTILLLLKASHLRLGHTETSESHAKEAANPA
ncbi:hypothetical protein [Streptomyces sp. NPDC058989]|uniref:hypothetical protein n=1 Tax=Streptomyces sp. NPDC058989 TaxID=3346686 RepID=UPI0036C37995